mmetsp:Transcript_18143/g.58836  ORF Transcript_18143/g.58836 Transcript_18143/m.58836 type:complete len:147 (+) Transcript_18143:1091-1531(+)
MSFERFADALPVKHLSPVFRLRPWVDWWVGGRRAGGRPWAATLRAVAASEGATKGDEAFERAEPFFLKDYMGDFPLPTLWSWRLPPRGHRGRVFEGNSGWRSLELCERPLPPVGSRASTRAPAVAGVGAAGSEPTASLELVLEPIV